jgi:hypothetical protein
VTGDADEPVHRERYSKLCYPGQLRASQHI